MSVRSLLDNLYYSLRTDRAWYEVRYSLRSIWGDLTEPFRTVAIGLRNLWDYLPVIWRDRDWDQSWLFELMEFKLRRMSRLHAKGHLMRSGSTAKQLFIAAALCRRLREDKYAEPLWDRHSRKWGEMLSWLEPTSGPQLSSWESSFPNATTDELKEQCRKEILCVPQHEQYLQDQDLEYLGRVFAKYALTWWD